jgi:hypothetical protein
MHDNDDAKFRELIDGSRVFQAGRLGAVGAMACHKSQFRELVQRVRAAAERVWNGGFHSFPRSRPRRSLICSGKAAADRALARAVWCRTEATSPARPLRQWFVRDSSWLERPEPTPKLQLPTSNPGPIAAILFVGTWGVGPWELSLSSRVFSILPVAAPPTPGALDTR